MLDVTPAHEYDFSQAYTKNRIRGLWRMMTGFRLQYAGATASLAVAASAKTVTFLLLRYFVDQVLGAGDYHLGGNLSRTLVIMAFGFLACASLEGSFSYFSGRLAAFTAEGITRRLRNYLFDHIQHLDFSYHDKTPTGELIERCTSDVDALRRVRQLLRPGGRASVFVPAMPELGLLSITAAGFRP